MARKKELEEQQEIPQDLSGLKRQTLQKLCKSLGLKANGKNVEMVRLLEEFRDKKVADQPDFAENSCSELREEKDEENSGTPESARERRLTYSVSPVPPSEPPHLHDNLPPPSPPTDDVVAVPTSGSWKRRLTHSISPSSSLLQSGPPSELSPLHDNTSPPADDVVAVTTSGSRKRRLTHSISPSSSLLQSGTISVAMTTSSTPEREMDTEEKVGEGAVSAVMALLEQRVADRKADPGYVAPTTLVDSQKQAGSRIPLPKTATQRANKAHEKLFSQMPSILEYSEKRKKRALTAQNGSTPAPPTKRQKTQGTPHTSLRKAAPTPQISTTGVKASVSATAMKYNQKPNFNFSKTAAISGQSSGATATPKSTANKESRPFTFSAKPPAEKKTNFKKHTGKLPDFKFSIY